MANQKKFGKEEALEQYLKLRPEGTEFLNRYPIFDDRPTSAKLTEKLLPLMKDLPEEIERKTIEEIVGLSDQWARSQSFLKISESPDSLRSKSLLAIRTAVKSDIERMRPQYNPKSRNLYETGTWHCLRNCENNFKTKDIGKIITEKIISESFAKVEEENRHSNMQYDADLMDAVKSRQLSNSKKTVETTGSLHALDHRNRDGKDPR